MYVKKFWLTYKLFYVKFEVSKSTIHSVKNKRAHKKKQMRLIIAHKNIKNKNSQKYSGKQILEIIDGKKMKVVPFYNR
ncbi:hypothetical protein MLEAa_5940 [Mycoplasma leachii 06049]|uniref:Uncharacterized protein n=1 Tax=Mycoplasma leachii 06049 TaxID=1188244 RepID=A0A2T4I8Y6_9MOLU|nr:hypothetical protein MLEAa_5940 [Mycoplasma leachii 06049]